MIKTTRDRYLITGASGFIGQACLPFLLKGHCDIIAVHHTRERNALDISEDIHVQQLDLFDKNQRVALLEQYKPTHLLHLAWHVPPGEFWESYQNIPWLKVSVDLFQEFCQNGGKHFVGAGSLAEYDWNHMELDELRTPLQPKTLYGQCKKSTFEIIHRLQQYHESVRVAWARIGFFFGEMEPSNKLISQLIQNISHGDPLSLVDKNIIRCYSHVRYLGEALTQLLLSNDAEGAFNVSSPYPTKVEDLVEYLMNYIQGTSQITYGKFTPKTKEPLHLIPSTQRLIKATNLNPPNTLWEDLARMVDHYV